MALYTEISLEDLKTLVGQVPEARDARIEDGNLLFKYQDKDKDLLAIIVDEIDRQRVLATIVFAMPKDHFLASMLAANSWDMRKDTHNTFSYVIINDEHPAIALESHLLLAGGVTGENIRFWVANLIEHANAFENHFLDALRKTGDDKDIIGNLVPNRAASETQSNNGLLSKLIDASLTAADLYLRSQQR